MIPILEGWTQLFSNSCDWNSRLMIARHHSSSAPSLVTIPRNHSPTLPVTCTRSSTLHSPSPLPSSSFSPHLPSSSFRVCSHHHLPSFEYDGLASTLAHASNTPPQLSTR